MNAGAVRHLSKGNATRPWLERRKPAWAEAVLNYVLQRQNRDGGYTFAQGADSNAQDTYYGLAILKLLNAQPPLVPQTANWLRSLPANDLYAHYYVSKALALCGEPIHPNLAVTTLAFRRSDGSFGTVDVGVGAPSEFHSTFMASEMLRMLGLTDDADMTIGWLLGYRNGDGGFGANGCSNLRSTFHAVASLHNLSYPVKSMRATIGYVRSCEQARGGFSVVPGSSMPYMEDTYCGVLALDLMGGRCQYPERTADRVYECFNSNGGFRRSVELGISTFEDTYYALTILREVENHG